MSGIKKIFGARLASVTGSFNSRWRPAAILNYDFALTSRKNHCIDYRANILHRLVV